VKDVNDMVQLALKKKESRLLWEILIRGIVATDRANRQTPAPDQEAYRSLKSKVLRAAKSGLIVGAVRPKKRIRDMLPNYLLKETDLALLKKADKRAKAKAKRGITVPNRRTPDADRP
jgi:hypothetical protein